MFEIISVVGCVEGSVTMYDTYRIDQRTGHTCKLHEALPGCPVWVPVTESPTLEIATLTDYTYAIGETIKNADKAEVARLNQLVDDDLRSRQPPMPPRQPVMD